MSNVANKRIPVTEQTQEALREMAFGGRVTFDQLLKALVVVNVRDGESLQDAGKRIVQEAEEADSDRLRLLLSAYLVSA